ncbi:NADPH-dependent FMN reductase [Paenibacillus sp. HB172176]|uniref:NADPH-dependent FMN reductase n=1 Tax=Paenibacillus sp. HB172176 TaxID=2493690 RepID=UPI00143B106D|nr:NADPH-dependent FMN reductase [Paenibacillus sp. HB172176]
MKIAAIVGSNRIGSYNLKLAEFMKERYSDRLDMDIITLQNVPFYNQDIENDPPAEAQAFIQRVKSAEAVLWVTPEYNGSIPGVLKNAIDWLSRGEKVMIGKPSSIIGASMGNMGTVKAQLHLRQILASPGLASPLLPGNEVYIPVVHEKIDEEGKFNHEPTTSFLDRVVSNFITWHGKHTSAFNQ